MSGTAFSLAGAGVGAVLSPEELGWLEMTPNSFVRLWVLFSRFMLLAITGGGDLLWGAGIVSGATPSATPRLGICSSSE